MLISIVMAAVTAVAEPAAEARVIETYSNDWARRPVGADMAEVYPLAAQKQMRVGVAVALCVVGAKGAMTECRVSGERPEGFGFGDAAVVLAAKFRLKTSVLNSLSPVGSHVLIPIPFRLVGGH